MNIIFSVIIPTYNREKALHTAVLSVLNQTYKNFELIIVDNGSTDDTKKIVAELQKYDKRVQYIYQANSGSPAGSRNTGIKNAKFSWISFLDSDDIWKPQKLEEVQMMISNYQDKIIAISHWEEQTKDEVVQKILRHGQTHSKSPYLDLLLRGNCYSTSAMTVKKEALLKVGSFNESREYITVEDYDLWLKLAKIGKIISIPKTLGEFRVGDNLSSNIDLSSNNLLTLVGDHIRNLDFSEQKIKKLLRIHLSRVEYYRGRLYQKSGQFTSARKSFIHSIIRYPFAILKWLALLMTLCKLRI